MEILDRAVRSQKAILDLEIRLFVRRAVDSLPHTLFILGMNSLKHPLQCGLNRSIMFEDIVGFFRPVNLAEVSVSAEAAGVAYALPLCQVGLAAFQLGIEAGVLSDLRLQFRVNQSQLLRMQLDAADSQFMEQPQQYG